MANVKVTLCSEKSVIESRNKAAPRSEVVLGTTSDLLVVALTGNTDVTAMAIPEGTLIRVSADGLVTIRIGASPTAVAGDPELLADTVEYFVAPVDATEVSVRLP